MLTRVAQRRGAASTRSFSSKAAKIEAILDRYSTDGPKRRRRAGVSITHELLWGEMDAYQHVNNVAYLRHFETARIKWFYAAAEVATALDADFDRDGFLAGRTVGPILASSSLSFRRPCAYPDTIYSYAASCDVREDRFDMVHTTYSGAHGDAPVTIGTGCVVVVDYRSDPPRKCAIPDALREAIAIVDGDETALGEIHPRR